MLVLSRHKDEGVIIQSPDGTRISISVVEIRGDKTRLGFEAPKDWTIHRDEVWDRIEKERIDCERSN